MKLFDCEDSELSSKCIEAEFNDNHDLKIDEDNCVRDNGIIFFKHPLHMKYVAMQTGILDRAAIVKLDESGVFVYMFALTESKKDYDTICDYYDNNNLYEKGYTGREGFPKGWERSLGLMRGVN
jgi:hypothetical protein